MESLLCTVAECAALLHVSVDTIKRSIKSGIIPAKRLRATVRISRVWIDSYVAELAPVLLTRRQVAVKLGIGPYALRSLLRKGLLPLVTVGKVQHIPAAAVAEYLKRNAFAFLRSVVPQRNQVGVRISSAPRALQRSCGTRFGSVRGV